MTDHNARQAGLTDERIRAIHRSVPNHHIDFARAIEREVLAAHSADARNGEGVALTDEQRELLTLAASALDFKRGPASVIEGLQAMAGECSDRRVLDGYLNLRDEAYTAWSLDERFSNGNPRTHFYAGWAARRNASLLSAPAAPASEPCNYRKELAEAMGHPDGISSDGKPIGLAWELLISYVKDWRGVIEEMERAQDATPAPAAQADELPLAREVRATLNLIATSFHNCKGSAATMQELARDCLHRFDAATVPGCTCPSGNGSLRHPCPVHAVEAAKVMCGCGDQYPMDSYEAGFIEGRGHCENCDAMSATPAVPVEYDRLSLIADAMIDAYKEHYDFPAQGELHMHDCIMGELETMSRTPRNKYESHTCHAGLAADAGALNSGVVRTAAVTPADAASEADKIDYSLARGDTVYSPYWGEGTRPVEVVDVNWALRAAAVRLAPKGGIVVWPVSHLQRERQHGAKSNG